MGATENRVCVRCFNPVEKARIEVLGNTGLCSACAHALAKVSDHWPTSIDRQLSMALSPIPAFSQKQKKTPVDSRILMNILVDGQPRQVQVTSTYILTDIYLDVVPDGEIWSQPILLKVN